MKNGIVITLAMVAFMLVCGCSEEKRYSSIYTTEPAANLEQSYDAPATATEVDLVEKLAQQRQEYVEALLVLKDYYAQTGNFRKSQWADREMQMLGDTPQYKFLSTGELTTDNVKNLVAVPQADALYEEAKGLYNKARFTAIVGDTPSMRKSLNLFNELIETYPNSNKVDDSAYYAGQIYHFFKDYKLAALYYKRALQWNPNIDGYPIRYKLASVLDTQLGERYEALYYYNQALEKESGYATYIEDAKLRIKQIERTKAATDAKREIKN